MHICINYILCKCISITITCLGTLFLFNKLVKTVSHSSPCPDLPKFPDRKIILKMHPPLQMPVIQRHCTKNFPFKISSPWAPLSGDESCPPKFICWRLNPQHLRIWLYSEIRFWKMELSKMMSLRGAFIPIWLIRSGHEDIHLSQSKDGVRHGQKAAKESGLRTTQPADILVLDLQPPEPWDNKHGLSCWAAILCHVALAG